MIITCPFCQTRYKVALDAIGAAGRQVQCASCHKAWMAAPSFPASAMPPPDPEPDADEIAFAADRDVLFTEGDEALLDEAFEAEADAGAARVSADPVDPGLAQRRRQALARRREDINRSLPLARMRRIARVLVALVLAALIMGGIGFRTEIVRALPSLDLLYRAVGLGTNVIGLDFADVRTLRTTRDGVEVLGVTAHIVNAGNHGAPVPPVLVTLMGEDRGVIYEWSVNPDRRSILPGERLSIETQLTAPPAGVARIRLTFVQGRGSTPPNGGQ